MVIDGFWESLQFLLEVKLVLSGYSNSLNYYCFIVWDLFLFLGNHFITFMEYYSLINYLSVLRGFAFLEFVINNKILRNKDPSMLVELFLCLTEWWLGFLLMSDNFFFLLSWSPEWFFSRISDFNMFSHICLIESYFAVNNCCGF